MTTQTVKKKKSNKRAPSIGHAYVQSTFNNTIISVAATNGDVISAASGGKTQKGARKSTAHAAEEAAKLAGAKAVDMGMHQVTVFLKGPGSGRETAIRALQGCGLQVLIIKDITPVPHNGCRPPKKRRV